MSEVPELSPLQTRLDDLADLGFPLATIEKDYAISYMLAGIAAEPGLAALVFMHLGHVRRRCIFDAAVRRPGQGGPVRAPYGPMRVPHPGSVSLAPERGSSNQDQGRSGHA